MGKRRGRPPKPTHLRLVEGNPGRRPINENEPKPPVEKSEKRLLAACPTWLSHEAKLAWKRTAPMLRKMGLLTRADVDALAQYCAAYARWKKAMRFLEANGESYPLRDNEGKVRCVQPWPEVSIVAQAQKTMNEKQQEFGLTPASRVRLSVPGGPPDQKQNQQAAAAARLLTR